MTEIPLGELAQLLMLTERRIQQLAKEHIIPKAKHGKYDLVGSVQGYIKYLDQVKTGRRVLDPGVPDKITQQDLLEENVRLTKAKADKQELEAEQLKGNLLPVADVQAAWVAMVSHMRAKILSIPTKAAPKVVAYKKAAEVQRVLKKYVYEALSELKETEVFIDSSGAPEPGHDGQEHSKDGGPAARSDGK